MSRWSSSPKAMSKKAALDPVWRGVGCVVLVALTLGGFWGAGELIKLNAQKHFLPFSVPFGYTVHVFGPLYVPVQTAMQLGFMLVLDIIGYALMTIVYGLLNPIRPGEKDAAPMYRSGPRKPSR